MHACGLRYALRLITFGGKYSTMRHILLSISLWLANMLCAQWTTPDLNTPVSATNGVGAARPQSAPGPDGSTYVCWFENSSGSYVYKMQRLDVDGNALWAPGGILVSAEAQSSASFQYDMKCDSAGNAIVAIQDILNDAMEVVVYKISPDGISLWPGGLPLLTQGIHGYAVMIGILANDRVVIAYHALVTPLTVAYRIIEADGSQPGVPLVIDGSGINIIPCMVPTSDGGSWLLYTHITGQLPGPGTLMAVRCDATGVAGPEINVSASPISYNEYPEPISDGNDGFYVAFNTFDMANENFSNVIVQRVRADGTKWSTNGVPVEEGVLNERYTGTATATLISDDDGLMIAYRFRNLVQTEGGIAVQKIDTAGVTQLGPNGSILVNSSSALPLPFGNIATPDGLVAAYTTGEFGNVTAHAVQVDLNGAVVQPVIDLCTTPSGKDDATITPFRSGQAVAVWQDERNGGSIYAQPILLDINIGLAEHRDDGIVLLGGAAPSLLFRSATPATTLRITDVNGRLLHEQRLPAQAEGAQVLLPLPDVAGVYVVVVESTKGPKVLRVLR